MNVTTASELANVDDIILSKLPIPIVSWYLAVSYQGHYSSRFTVDTNGNLKTFWDNPIPSGSVLQESFSYPIA